jgi:Oligoendopeptidase F
MSDRKAEMSFTTYLDDYDAPFLFVYPYGDLEDIISAVHEFGHCTESYISYGRYRSLDQDEIFSEAMQFLSLGKLEEALGKKDAEKLRLLNLYDALDTFVSQAALAEFEERAFALEEPSVEALNALSREIDEEYGLEYDDPEIGAMAWIDILHFFEQPGYCISYPVACCCALEIYENELREPGAGLEQFMNLVYSQKIGIIGAAADAGLQNPLTEERVREAAAFLEAQLNA